MTRASRKLPAPLELDGFVTGETNSNGNVAYLAISLKLAVGQADMDLAVQTVVAVEGMNFSLANIYSAAVTSNETDIANLMANVTDAPDATRAKSKKTLVSRPLTTILLPPISFTPP